MALAGALFGTNLMAQPSVFTQMTSASIRQQTLTTGMAGFTPNQTARLSVLNLNPVSTASDVPPNCTIELQFFDAQNHSLKQSVVPGFAPQTATSLDLTAAATTYVGLTPPSLPRLQIRGVVTVNPAPTPVMNPAPVGNCNVMVTLEIFDSTTGNTVALTTDTRLVAAQRGGTWAQSPVPK